MDEAEALVALANLLDTLSQNPYDISLHAQHISVATKTGMEDQVRSAREMMTAFWAVGEDVWLPLIEDKVKNTDLNTLSGVSEVLTLFDRAEADYLSIQILRNHLDFLIERYTHFSNLDIRPDELGDVFSVEWTSAAISEVVLKGSNHLTESHLLWDVQRDWELEILESTPATKRSPLIDHIESLFLNRLQQPHSNNDETFQFYSTFTSTYKPPQEYESLLVIASKLRSPAVESYRRKESRELALSQAHSSLEAYAYYINGERRPKKLDLFALSGLYERAIAAAAKSRLGGNANAEIALRSFWIGYCDTLRISEAEYSVGSSVFQRALRSVPSSGEVWARYLRFLERAADENAESISDAFNRALSTNLLQSDVEQIVPITLAHAGADKRRTETDEEAFGSLIKVLEEGIVMVRAASKTGDLKFRLEKYLTELYLKIDLPDSAIAIWQDAVKHTKSSYLAWSSYADVLIKQDRYDDARGLFKDICNKKLDWPEAIWEAWIAFEHLWGSVQDLEDCLDRVEKAQGFLQSRRAKEAEQAASQDVQPTSDHPTLNVLTADTTNSHAEAAMDLGVQPGVDTVDIRKKRKTMEDTPEDTMEATNKRIKIGLEQPLLPLKRDRENCTVFVSDLPEGTQQEDLTGLFRDCGAIRDVKITPLSESLVATVEFSDRDSVPAALTKDKKRISGAEINVHLAWKSTLYVTNFPAKMDDAGIKKLFEKYGTLFDVRWPSKKFKSTRRFCYVQFTSPDAAEAALEVHGQELEDGLALNVFISNPERKKERSDADANDKEVYVAGLSKFATKEDLENLFRTYGPVKDVRMILNEAGHSKGFAFVEFELEKDAISALNANNHELKNRRIAVTLADTRVKPKRNAPSDSGLGRLAEIQSRSVRIRGLPLGTQEGLLQQSLEQHASVKRVEVYNEIREATVELTTAADAGKLLLSTDPIVFKGVNLSISEEDDIAGSLKPGRSKTASTGMFVPRKTAGPRPRAGLGFKKTGLEPIGKQNKNSGQDTPSGSQRGQDEFRKMLGDK